LFDIIIGAVHGVVVRFELALLSLAPTASLLLSLVLSP
jgi:hypothetical protein